MMRYNNYRTLLLISSVFLLLITLFISLSCEPIAPFKISNQTDKVLTIYITGWKIGEVLPGEEIENDYVAMHCMKDSQYYIEARDKEDNLIYLKKITFEESSDIDWKITITNKSID